MQPKFNLWIEQDGEVVLSQWRVRLLELNTTDAFFDSPSDPRTAAFLRGDVVY